jgi:hypothetical protein
MKNALFLFQLVFIFSGLWAQQFSIPAGAELLESTEFRNNGIPYIIERRYRLPSGETLYAYYDVEGQSSVTIQRIEQIPILALGTDINISGMPGYREFSFGDDRRKLVQFMKLLKLGEPMGTTGANRVRARVPSLSDYIFRISTVGNDEYVLLLDLYDETWVLEHRLSRNDGSIFLTNTTRIIRVSEYSE